MYEEEGEVMMGEREGEYPMEREGEILQTEHEGELPLTEQEGELPLTEHEGEMPLTEHEGEMPLTEQEGEMPLTEHEGEVAPSIKSEPRSQRKSGRDNKASRQKKNEKKRERNLSFKQQQLFLVEFLVDTVMIDSCAVDEEVLEGQTCISLNFLNFPPMEICEKDFNPNKEQGKDKVRFNCGKSLMFAFSEKQCDRPPPLIVEITVSKKLGGDDNPIKVDIGVIKICISEIFRQIIDIVKFKPEKLPTSKSIKDCFMLIGPGKRTMGEVSVYIRLSCLGQNVVTEFQCGSDLKTSPVLFKSGEGKKAYEFTGCESQPEGETIPRSKGHCGCLPPPIGQSQNLRGGQGDVGGAYTKGNRVVLDLPDKHQKVESRSGPNKSGDYKMNTINTNDDVTVSQMNAFPDHNCFVLRVGDKGQIPDRGKMILEFRAPKQKILPKVLPPYHEDVGVQTDTLKKSKGKKKK